MRSVRIWSLFLCSTGLLLFFAHLTVGQGARELFDPNLSTPQQRAITPAFPVTPPVVPQFAPAPSSNTLPGNDLVIPVAPYSLPTSRAGIPISDELRQLLTKEPPAADPGTPPTAAPRVDIEKQVMGRLTSVLEDETEDEPEEREVLALRQRAEQIVDPARRRSTLDQFIQAERAREQRLTRRAMDEVGAYAFYFPRLKEQYLNAGWCQLFDGHTNTGWQIQNSGHYAGGKFTFGNGEICSDPYHPGMVYTSIPFGNISLRFDYWAEKDSEALLLMNTPPNPEDLNNSCYTFVLNSGQSSRPRGLLLGRHGYTLPQLRAMREMWDDPTNTEEGTWHTIRVRIEEGHIQVWMDRRGETAYFDPKPLAAGHIAFLVWKGQARFQNIIWQPEQAIAVFDAEGRNDLPWYHSEKLELLGDNTSGFRLLGGSIESKDVFGNYVLQMQYYQGANSGRSSLFVRALPQQVDTGYEISLQNFPKRQDRMSVVGVDAGAFRQRKDARYVRAQDMQWTHLTVAVMNRQMATWVNGVPVCEIEEQRTVPFPPGTGPFLEPGTIRLSVPEDNTLFQFRRLTVSPVKL